MGSALPALPALVSVVDDAQLMAYPCVAFMVVGRAARAQSLSV
jgi:hypothetical protein